MQGCSYTYETHQPIHKLVVTGEEGKQVVISALGDGHLLVMGLEKRNQSDIIMDAHDNRIIQIISLGHRPKLNDKYFATRDVDGDVNVWSAN